MTASCLESRHKYHIDVHIKRSISKDVRAGSGIVAKRRIGLPLRATIIHRLGDTVIFQITPPQAMKRRHERRPEPLDAQPCDLPECRRTGCNGRRHQRGPTAAARHEGHAASGPRTCHSEGSII